MDLLDPDIALRLAVFAHVARLRDASGGAVPASALNAGLVVDGERMPIWNQQKGIFRPARMRNPGAALTVVTSVDGPYDDRLDDSDESRFVYRYRGTDPLHADNVAVRRAMELRGVDPDYHVHLREDILEEHDGPMLKHGLQEMHGQRIQVPAAEVKRPNRDYLAERFAQFRAA